MECFLDFWKPWTHLWAILGPFYWPKWHIFPPFYILQLEKSLPSYISEAWKRYPFREKRPSITHHREYPPPKTQSVACLFAKKIKENLLQVQRRRKNAHFCGIEPLLAYLWGQTIQAEKNKPPKIFFTIRILENKVSKRFALRTDFNLRAIDGSLTSNTYKEKGLEQMPFCQFIPKQHLTF